MLKIVETTEGKVTKIKCPRCEERLGYVGLLPNSSVRGLVFKCKKCGGYWKVLSRKDKNKKPIEVGGETLPTEIDGKERCRYEKG